MSHEKMDRRNFIRNAALCGAGIGAAKIATAQDSSAPPPPSAPASILDAEGAVPRRKLGSTGMTIPILFMGGSQKFDPKYDKVLHRAHKMGIDYIDTAQSYGGGQSHVGVAAFHKQVGRDKVWITSKTHPKPETPEKYKEGLDDCLKTLETDYVDMYFMHMIKSEEQLNPEYIKMGDDMKKSGKTKFFGFSCHDGNVAELMQKAAKVGGIDAIQFRISYRQYGDAALNAAIDACKKAGIGLLAMKTQSSIPEDEAKVVAFQSKEFSLGQAKLKSIWADDRIDGLVSQITNVELLQENAAAAMSPVQLTLTEFNQLQQLARMTRSSHCLGCTHLCETKIAGKIRVGDALRYLMYADSYHDPETGRMLYAALESWERDFEGIDFTEANKACPQGIDIERRLSKAREVLMA